FERLVVSKAGRCDSAFLREDKPDAGRAGVMRAKPCPPGSSIPDHKFGELFSGRHHRRPAPRKIVGCWTNNSPQSCSEARTRAAGRTWSCPTPSSSSEREGW